MDDITIGSDPEFFFKHVGADSQVKASTLTDVCRFRVTDVGDVGLDGHADIAELRPKHSADVRSHIRNIHILLSEMSQRATCFGNVGIYAGSWVKSVSEKVNDGDGIGGHIHFGLVSQKAIGNTMRKDLLADLDYWLAPITLLLEKENTARNRRNFGTHGHAYGCLDNGRYRTPPWGLEYRPLSSWIVAPHIAQAVLCYAKAIAHASINNKLPPRPYEIGDGILYTKYKEVNRKWLFRHFNKLQKSWRLMPLVTENKYIASGLGILTHLIRNNLVWKEDVDLRDNWKLRRQVPIVIEPEEDILTTPIPGPAIYIDFDGGTTAWTTRGANVAPF